MEIPERSTAGAGLSGGEDAQPIEGDVKLGRHAALKGLSRGVKPSSTVRAAPRPAVRFRPWRSQRKMYVVIYRGALRRRRRRARLRVFNNARTATRNLDLPLAIGRSPSHPAACLLHRRIPASVWRQQANAKSRSTDRLEPTHFVRLKLRRFSFRVGLYLTNIGERPVQEK